MRLERLTLVSKSLVLKLDHREPFMSKYSQRIVMTSSVDIFLMIKQPFCFFFFFL